MRFTFLMLLALLLCALSMAQPLKDDKRPPAKKCSKLCGEYVPICAKAKNSKDKERLITFGNQCLMDNFNCEHPDDEFVLKAAGECGGNVSVRLS